MFVIRFIQDYNIFVPHLWINIAEKSVKVVQECDSDGRQVHRDVNGPGKVAAFGRMNNVFLVQFKIIYFSDNTFTCPTTLYIHIHLFRFFHL